MEAAELARIPCGKVSKALRSSMDPVRRLGFLFNGDPSGRFFGRPRSMIEDAPSDSWRRWPGV